MGRVHLIGLAVIVATGALWATTARAQNSLTGNKLIGDCAEALKDDGRSVNLQQAGYCTGLVRGVLVIATLEGLFCPPEGLPLIQVIRVVHNFLETNLEHNPARLHFPDGTLALFAIQETWPCSP